MSSLRMHREHFSAKWATDSWPFPYLLISSSPRCLSVQFCWARLTISSCVLRPVTLVILTLVSCPSQRTVCASSKKKHEFCSRQDINDSLGVWQLVDSCVAGSPLREDSPAGSPYALSASSPEQSLSSLSSPSSRHLIHRESPDLRDAEDDDHHTVSVLIQGGRRGVFRDASSSSLRLFLSQKSVGVEI